MANIEQTAINADDLSSENCRLSTEPHQTHPHLYTQNNQLINNAKLLYTHRLSCMIDHKTLSDFLDFTSVEPVLSIRNGL